MYIDKEQVIRCGQISAVMETLDTIREYLSANQAASNKEKIGAQIGELDMLVELHRLLYEYSDVTIYEETDTD